MLNWPWLPNQLQNSRQAIGNTTSFKRPAISLHLYHGYWSRYHGCRLAIVKRIRSWWLGIVGWNPPSAGHPTRLAAICWPAALFVRNSVYYYLINKVSKRNKVRSNYLVKYSCQLLSSSPKWSDINLNLEWTEPALFIQTHNALV